MATAITLSYFGPPEQKAAVKVPPMQTLGDALAAAAAKFKPPLQPERCALTLNKKRLDLATPFRLLNVPAGSKLEVLLLRGAGAAANASAASSSAPAAAAAPPPPPAAAAPPPAVAAPAQQPPPPPAAAAAAATAPQPQPAAASSSQPSSSAAAAAAATAAMPPPAALVGPLAALGVAGEVFVFHQRTLEAAAAAAAQDASPMEQDPPDAFFELTPDDLARLQQQANDKKKAAANFKTRAARDAEARARAAALAPVRVRLHFPNATILQASFGASQPLSAVQQLVRRVALPSVAPALYLYTTPPKTLLKDAAATLYQLQLVPAAHIHVGCDSGKLQQPHAGPFLRPEVMALVQATLPAELLGGQQQQQEDEATAADAQRLMAAAAAASRSEGPRAGGSSGASGGAKVVPKWMKLGK